jgi:hypothetical protein
MGDERKVYKVLVGKPEGNYSEDRGVDGRMGLEGSWKYWLRGCGVNSTG